MSPAACFATGEMLKLKGKLGLLEEAIEKILIFMPCLSVTLALKFILWFLYVLSENKTP